jgi:hypothetical protein
LTCLAFYAVPVCRAGGGYRAAGVSYESWVTGALEALRHIDPAATRADARRTVRMLARRWPQAFSYNPWWAVHTATRRGFLSEVSA